MLGKFASIKQWKMNQRLVSNLIFSYKKGQGCSLLWIRLTINLPVEKEKEIKKLKL